MPDPSVEQHSVHVGDKVVEGYARAILAAAEAEDVTDRVADELFRFAQTLAGNTELRERLNDPKVEVAAKLAVVDDLLSAAHPQTPAAAMFVIHAGRTRHITQIAEAVVQLAAEARAKVVAIVRSAVELSQDHQRRLADALSESTGQQIEIKVLTDPSVVGGVVVSIGDTVIDGSVARRLAEFRSRLTGT